MSFDAIPFSLPHVDAPYSHARMIAFLRDFRVQPKADPSHRVQFAAARNLGYGTSLLQDDMVTESADYRRTLNAEEQSLLDNRMLEYPSSVPRWMIAHRTETQPWDISKLFKFA